MISAIHATAHHRGVSTAGRKLIYPATERNKDPILKVLKRLIHPGPDQHLLELASGSGQHTAHFAPHFPQVTFYPSEYDDTHFDSIRCWTQGLANVKEPVQIDASVDYKTWAGGSLKEKSFDYIYCCNMLHVSPFKCTIGLFKAAGQLLKPEGLLITYGAYAIDGKINPESNVEFDKNLRKQNPEWGLRDIRELEKLALENDIKLVEMISMPANNFTIAWKKI